MPFVALVHRSLARGGHALGGLLVLLTGFQVVLVLMASSYSDTRSFETMATLVPSLLQDSMGGLLGVFASFQGLVSFGFFHPIVVVTMAQYAVFVASEPAAEVEGGLVDLVMARPVPRWWIPTRSLVVMILASVVIVCAMALAIRVTLSVTAPANPWPSARAIGALALNLVALAWCVGAVSLAVAATARRRAAAFPAVGVVAVLLYLLEFVSTWWEAARPFGPLSPFHYYQGLEIVSTGTVPWSNVLVLLAGTVVFTAIAYWQYLRRDL